MSISADQRDASRRYDLAVVGAGIVGLAVARELILRHPDIRLVVLEKEPGVAAHQTGHNTGVIHTGVYYAPGSLKARLCVEGARALYDYCEQHRIPTEKSGKVIVATRQDELAGLDELERRGRANNVAGLSRIGAERLVEIEPHARGLAAIHCAATGVVSYAAVAESLAANIRGAGGQIALAHRVTGVTTSSRRVLLEHAHGTTEAAFAIFCAGTESDLLARAAGASDDPRVVPFRGGYLRLKPERRQLVRGMIYPVPTHGLPFLGVHLTRQIDGEVLIGPTSLLVGARDAYRLSRLVPADMLMTLLWPGTFRMARQWWRTGLAEIQRAISRKAVVRDAARYVPELTIDDVLRGPAGIRAQAVGRDGSLVDDFAFSYTERALHVRSAPSPAATSSLAIAHDLVGRLEPDLDLPRRAPLKA
jgi:L-2-hydroxyglutarate oxidase